MSNDFIKEDIKKKPINKGKVFKKMLTTIALAVIFGVVASLIILVLEPFLQKITTKKEEPAPSVVSFPEEEMSPEEMLSEYMMQESALAELSAEEVEEEAEPVELPLSEDQISAILSRFKVDATKYRQMMIQMSNYAREIGNYVVTITAVKSSVDWLNSVNDSSNVTSGIVIAENNIELLILADSTPLKNSDSLTMATRNGFSAPAYIKEIDDVTGLAIIGVSLSDVPEGTDIEALIAPLGSSSGIYVGLSVIAVGSPKGVSGSIGYGMVDTPRTMITDADTFMYCYQTDIPASKNSSGVLFNMQGQVVGIITNNETSTTGSNVVMIYGITELKGLIEKMSNGQEISYLGISGTNVTSQANAELGVPMGAFITATDMDSPAMLAGVQVGDVIVAMNDQKISTFIEYVNVLQNIKPGETVTLTIQRKSQDEYVPIDIELTVMARSHE